jgi:hypothetical protein
MWNVDAQSRAGSLAASVVASVDVDTRKLCPRGPWDSMRHQVPVVLAVDSEVALVEEASVEGVSAVTAVVTVVIALDLAEESVTKEVAMASVVDSRLQMLPLAQVVVDAVGSEAATAVVVEEEETDSTVAVLAATESPSGPEIATLTVTVVVIAMVTATETATACQTAMETAAETVAEIVAETATGTVTVSVTGMAAERIMDGSDTVRTMNATTRDLGDDTIKCPSSLFFNGSYSFPFLSPDMLVGIPDFSVVRLFLHKVKGVRRELKRCIGKRVRDVQRRTSNVPNPRRIPPLLLF